MIEKSNNVASLNGPLKSWSVRMSRPIRMSRPVEYQGAKPIADHWLWNNVEASNKTCDYIWAGLLESTEQGKPHPRSTRVHRGSPKLLIFSLFMADDRVRERRPSSDWSTGHALELGQSQPWQLMEQLLLLQFRFFCCHWLRFASHIDQVTSSLWAGWVNTTPSVLSLSLSSLSPPL